MKLQVISEISALVLSVFQGRCYQSMERRMRCYAWAGTRQSIETRVTLECEREHQEHLLLSVMPAYIAAEVCIIFVFLIAFHETYRSKYELEDGEIIERYN